MSTKAPAKKPANIKDKLAKGAEEIRKLAAKAAPKKKAAAPAKEKPPESNGKLSVIPNNEKLAELFAKHVKISDDNTSLRLSDNIEIGEYLPIYDAILLESEKAQDLADKYQFVVGDLFNEGKRLFGKDFAALMAKEGRPVSTLKKWGSIAANIDIPLRNMHPALDWSHVAEVAKVPEETKKLEILEHAAKKLESGESVSVQDIRKEADKFKPRKKKGAKKEEPYSMTIEEQLEYDDFSKIAEDLNTYATNHKKSLRALFPKLTGRDKKAMRETLELVAELAEMVE